MKRQNIIIHNPVFIEEGTQIGGGTVVWHNSQVKEGAIIRENCIVGHNCFVDAGAKLGKGVKLGSNVDVWNKIVLEDFVFVAPGVVFINDKNPRAKYPKNKFPEYGKWLPILVKEGATLGSNSTILCGITIGKWAMIGAGSVVTKDIPDYALVIGNPGRIKGWVCECGKPLDFRGLKAACQICGRNYEKKNDKVEEIK